MLQNLQYLHIRPAKESFNDHINYGLQSIPGKLYHHEKQTINQETGLKNYGANLYNLQIHLPPSLRKLTVRISGMDSAFNHYSPTIHLSGQNNLIELHLSTATSFTGQLVIDKPNKYYTFFLDLSSNSLEDLNPRFLKTSITNGLKLARLNLQGNNLGFSFKRNTDFFQDFKDLKYLDLSKNSLSSLPSAIFQPLKNLETLHLDYNNLKTITFDLRYLTRLSFLDLSMNRIIYLDDDILTTLDKLAHNKTLEVGLPYADLVCSCDLLKFIDWVIETPVSIGNPACWYDNKVIHIRDSRTTKIHQLIQKCRSKTYIVATTVSLAVFVVVLGVLIFVYRHRWDVKFFCLKLVRNRKIYQDLLDHNMYKYDAFVVYDTEDHAWIDSELIPHLENPSEVDGRQEPKFTLCVHHRDFMPGTLIEENIIDSIQLSSKTILVLSNNFVASRWCEFELQIARTKCIEEGRDNIVVIILEAVPAAAMSSTLASLIRRVTYLEWPPHQAGKEEFWTKLRESLRRRDTKNPVCSCSNENPQQLI